MSQPHKVGILTFYYANDNFGAQLQARALVRAVDSIVGRGTAEQIAFDYREHLSFAERLHRAAARSFAKGVFTGMLLFAVQIVRSLYSRVVGTFTRLGARHTRRAEQVNLKMRREAFARFVGETPHSDIRYDINTIPQSIDRYECFICGGDQIWNGGTEQVGSEALDRFCLDFVPDGVGRFAYAPSVPAQKRSPEFVKRLADDVMRLDAISVRERSSAGWIEEATGRKVEIVVDPVLLLNREQWDAESAPVEIDYPYICAYLLGDGQSVRRAISALAARLGCKLLTFPHIAHVNKYDVGFGDILNYSAGPAEFISIIRGAQLVVTDSFHGAVMSMIYHKPLYAVERAKAQSSMGSRLTDFLGEYGLQDRFMTLAQLNQVNGIDIPDYAFADETLAHRRAESMTYLEENLMIRSST